MNLSKQQLIIIGIGAAAVLLLISVFTCAIPILKFCGSRPQGPAVSLEFWGAKDEADVYGSGISRFQAVYPNIKINYRKVDEAEYEKELTAAFLNGKAPDIFMIRHNSLPKYYARLAPAPREKFSLDSLRQFFPEVVEQDFAPDGSIFALPLYIDTLALYYNPSIFDQANVTVLPENWDAFQNAILMTRRLNSGGRIERAGAAIGGSEKSIRNATDLLNLLLLQSGTEMTNKDFTQATFNSALGRGALEFYLKFSNPAGSYYTWNDSQKYSLDAFANEETGMIFGYNEDRTEIEKKNPFLKLETLAMPQPGQAEIKVNYADYWGYAVSNRSLYPAAAWDFVLNLTTNFDNAKAYVETTKRPPALRPLVSAYLNDPDLGLFARQALTARSWPQADANEIKTIMSQMIADILGGRLTLGRALDQAASKVTQLMIRR